MKLELLSVATLTLVLGARTLGAQQAPPPGPLEPRVETSGHAEVRIVPDKATVVLSVQTKEQTAAKAASANARIQQRVLDTLRTLGLAGRQLSTVNYNVSPNYDQTPQGPRQNGYIATNSLRVEVAQISRIGTVIDASLARGATNVENVEFSSTHTDSARAAALTQAVAQARADADALARALGGKLGTLMEVSTGMPNVQPLMMQRGFAAKASSDATELSPGDIVVPADVTVRWRFVPSP
jgi:uncharacterized protein YggE